VQSSKLTNTEFAEKHRLRTGTRLGYLSIAINLFLFIIKLILGSISNSISIISDAFHTLTDTITSILVVFSFKISAKPSDPEHPFGHGRVEQITAIVMATLLGVTAFELLKTSIDRLFTPSKIEASFTIAAIMFATVLIKEGLAHYTKKYAEELKSDTLSADAWHHRSDAISTLIVIASIIIARFGYFFFDTIAGILIALYILYTAYIIVKKPIDHILGTPTPTDITLKIKNIGASIEQVLNLHDIIYHDYGAIKLVSLHIEVDENMPLNQAHQVAENVTHLIKENLEMYATVHVDPMSPKTEIHNEIENLIAKFCKSHDLCHSFHEVRFNDNEAEVNIFFELQINKQVSGKTQKALKQNLTENLKSSYPQIKQVKIEIDPLFLLET
jgi:cation diffusion facilitator family transporter